MQKNFMWRVGKILKLLNETAIAGIAIFRGCGVNDNHVGRMTNF